MNLTQTASRASAEECRRRADPLPEEERFICELPSHKEYLVEIEGEEKNVHSLADLASLLESHRKRGDRESRFHYSLVDWNVYSDSAELVYAYPADSEVSDSKVEINW